MRIVEFASQSSREITASQLRSSKRYTVATDNHAIAPILIGIVSLKGSLIDIRNNLVGRVIAKLRNRRLGRVHGQCDDVLRREHITSYLLDRSRNINLSLQTNRNKNMLRELPKCPKTGIFLF